jgi:transposase
MRGNVEVRLGPGDRERLEAVLADRNSPQKHVWRARIILATAEGCGTTEIMRRAGVAKPCVWRWQRRFMEEGVDGLLRDKTRKPGKEPVPEAVVEQLIERTLGQPPGETTHWTSRAMAKLMGLAISTVQRIWRAHGLAPHRLRTFMLSRDPQFAGKVRDVIGLYVDPPAHAVVLSVDEKSQIQALDRTQPGLPMKKGRAGTMTHDYKRNGTTTLFAALNVLDGPVGSADIPPGDRAQGPMVIGRCMQRHRAAASPRDPMSEGPPVSRPARRHQEFLRFLNRLERDLPAGKVIHVVLDNYGSHRHQKARAWLARHPRWAFHFTPTSASWLNAVEGFFAKLTNRRLRRGVFHSLVDLQAAINRGPWPRAGLRPDPGLAEHNRSPAPFVWTAKPDAIIAAASRGYQVLDSIH